MSLLDSRKTECLRRLIASERIMILHHGLRCDDIILVLVVFLYFVAAILCITMYFFSFFSVFNLFFMVAQSCHVKKFIWKFRDNKSKFRDSYLKISR